MANKDLTYSYLKSKGFNNAQCSGIMANIESESNYNPGSLGDNGTSFGICQWHKTRWERLKEYCSKFGKDINNLYNQLDFMLYELQLHYGSVYHDIMVTYPTDTVESAYRIAYSFCKNYEIPNDTIKRSQTRGDLAVEIYKGIVNTIPTPDPVQKKSVDELAAEVLRGVWGNGSERKAHLESNGYNYSEVQARVNELVGGSVSVPTETTYIIQPGDTLTKISNQFGVPIQKIAADNGIQNINVIISGQKLIIRK